MELKRRKYKYQRRNGSEGRGDIGKEISKLKENPDYLQYWLKKEEIRKGYPPITQMSRVEYLNYLKEVSELIHQADGDFQRWVWNSIDGWTKIVMDRKARGKKPRNHHWDEEFGGWVMDEE